MAGKIIQAYAGAGKTYYITHKLNPNKKYLYLTFTNENIENIKEQLEDNKKMSSNNYMVCTFSKFLIDWMIKPYFVFLKPRFKKCGGFTTNIPQNDARKTKGPKPYYKKQNKLHYTVDGKIFYLSRLSELVYYQGKNYFDKCCNRISNFFDEIVIDEYQDFTGWDLQILINLCKNKNINCLFVGDINQSGVSESSKRSKMKKSLKTIDTNNLKSELKKLFGNSAEVFDIDQLKKSRRISKDCAKFVNDKLSIPIESTGHNKKGVTIINSLKQFNDMFRNQKVEILTYNKTISRIPNHNYSSWSYVKGDTLDNVLVVLTNGTDFILSEKSANISIKSKATKNKLYVALTRSAGELYIVSSKVWKNMVSESVNKDKTHNQNQGQLSLF